MAAPSLIRSLRTALAGGWSPLGAATAAVLGVGYLLGLAWLVLWLVPRPHILVAPGEISRSVTIGGSEYSLRGVSARPETSAELSALLGRPENTLDGWPGGGTPLAVPAVYVSRLPDDLEESNSVNARKRLFVAVVLPLVLEVNDRIAAMRARLIKLRDRLAEGGELSEEERRWLERTANSYDVSPDDLDMLLRRVDVVPPSLAVAQAAIESAWGTSRFARKGNALFGQWTWRNGHGLVPKARAEDADYSVRRFPRLIDSVASYVHNLNTNAAYVGFRKLRAALRAAGKPLLAAKLAESLKSYSQRGQAYVDEVLSVIRQNRFGRLRDAHLVELVRD